MKKLVIFFVVIICGNNQRGFSTSNDADIQQKGLQADDGISYMIRQHPEAVLGIFMDPDTYRYTGMSVEELERMDLARDEFDKQLRYEHNVGCALTSCVCFGTCGCLLVGLWTIVTLLSP